jgi:hypothetical protein
VTPADVVITCFPIDKHQIDEHPITSAADNEPASTAAQTHTKANEGVIANNLKGDQQAAKAKKEATWAKAVAMDATEGLQPMAPPVMFRPGQCIKHKVHGWCHQLGSPSLSSHLIHLESHTQAIVE